MVFSHPLPNEDISGISMTEAGVPLFIAEVASKSTWGNDLGFKKEVYAFARVSEYITFDPAGHFIAPVLHAWRLEGAAYMPWVADEDGWWHSRALDLALQPTQPFITLRDREGRQISAPRRALEREYRLDHVERELAEAQRRIAEMEARLRQPRDE